MTYQSEALKHGHVHGEAFCLMWYQCKDCGAKERIWNSRDGVTPFGMSCESCGGHNKMHVNWGADQYVPDHKLHREQRFWRDGTPDEAVAIMTRRIESMRGKYPLSFEDEKRLIEETRNPNGENGEFQKGWPMLARTTVDGGTELG